ncbi:MAG: ATP-binding protein [Bacteroidetes bacterium]|nr:ATP-binding protein [Bacteroidota bacterium]MCY4226000.1 ATP-binding protein [Bacteroidota bacterium]
MGKKKLPPHGPPAFDRGPTPHFHGRVHILDEFSILLERAMRTHMGTTFIIQGAPGAGKTALLHKMGGDAPKPWQVVRIDPDALWDTNWLMHALDRGGEFNISEVTGGVSLAGYVKGDVTSVPVLKNPISVIKQWNAPLLLILDEAQTLAEGNKPEGKDRSIATNLLKHIHNGEMGRPVVLLAAGLGTTLGAFESLGLSRIGLKCDVKLGSLSSTSTRAIIQSWLTEDGRSKGDTATWVEEIAQESHNWPQHIAAYVEPALRHLQAHRGHLTPTGLSKVLELGRKGCASYYEQRVRKFDGDDVMLFAEAVFDIGIGKPFTKKMILSKFKEEYGAKKAESLFRNFIEKGIIAQDGYTYSIPIPSMHDWLKSELLLHKERLGKPPPSPHPNKSRGKSGGDESRFDMER